MSANDTGIDQHSTDQPGSKQHSADQKSAKQYAAAEPHATSRAPPTECSNPASRGIDRKSAREIVDVIHREDLRAWEGVGGALDAVARLADRVVEAFRRGGRLVYVGAGTSGRLGVLDAAECPPTFGVDRTLVVGLIAGGEEAIRSSIEGAEDSPAAGAAALRAISVRAVDVVCGIAASGTTPFVLGALEEARNAGAATALIACNPFAAESPEAPLADIRVELPVGPEVVAGSTRMKAGTATKMVLNMVTTAAMVRWGKVYDNLMVDLKPVNRKLVRRAIGLIERIGGVGQDQAALLLSLSGRNVKAAIVMARRKVGLPEAVRLLEEHQGLLRHVLEARENPHP